MAKDGVTRLSTFRSEPSPAGGGDFLEAGDGAAQAVADAALRLVRRRRGLHFGLGPGDRRGGRRRVDSSRRIACCLRDRPVSKRCIRLVMLSAPSGSGSSAGSSSSGRGLRAPAPERRGRAEELPAPSSGLRSRFNRRNLRLPAPPRSLHRPGTARGRAARRDRGRRAAARRARGVGMGVGLAQARIAGFGGSGFGARDAPAARRRSPACGPSAFRKRPDRRRRRRDLTSGDGKAQRRSAPSGGWNLRRARAGEAGGGDQAFGPTDPAAWRTAAKAAAPPANSASASVERRVPGVLRWFLLITPPCLSAFW
jgi:hypothetical protein